MAVCSCRLKVVGEDAARTGTGLLADRSTSMKRRLGMYETHLVTYMQWEILVPSCVAPTLL